MISFLYPQITNNSCVYKLVFDDGSFYIGSTKNMRVRIAKYRYDFKHPERLSFKMYTAFNINKSVSFEIIMITTPINHLHQENLFIKKYWNDSLLLNTSSDSRKPEGKRGKQHRLYKKGVGTVNDKKKKIIQYNLMGKRVGEFESCNAAARAIKSSSSNISRVANGKRMSAMGYVFRYAS